MKKFTLRDAKKILPTRLAKSNKSDGGRSLIIAGHSGLFGAAVLASTACSRAGSGYVTLLTDLEKFNLGRWPDFLTADYNEKSISKIKFDAVGIGPGLGKNTKIKIWLRQLAKLKSKNVVVDADALNAWAPKNGKPAELFPESWIVSPHEGELARLLNVSSKKIKNDRLKYVLLAAKKLNCIVLLKGAQTLIVEKNNIYQIQSGNASLAKAGTGDVLTGMITGFLAQGLAPLNAALLGAYVHGKIADDWLKDKNDILSLMASDLNSLMPKTLRRLR